MPVVGMGERGFLLHFDWHLRNTGSCTAGCQDENLEAVFPFSLLHLRNLHQKQPARCGRLQLPRCAFPGAAPGPAGDRQAGGQSWGGLGYSRSFRRPVPCHQDDERNEANASFGLPGRFDHGSGAAAAGRMLFPGGNCWRSSETVSAITEEIPRSTAAYRGAVSCWARVHAARHRRRSSGRRRGLSTLPRCHCHRPLKQWLSLSPDCETQALCPCGGVALPLWAVGSVPFDVGAAAAEQPSLVAAQSTGQKPARVGARVQAARGA